MSRTFDTKKPAVTVPHDSALLRYASANPGTATDAQAAPAEAAPADDAAPEQLTPMQQAMQTMHRIGHGRMSDKKLEQILQKGAKEYLILMTPPGQKSLKGDRLKAAIATLSPAKLVEIGQLGSGRAAVMETLAKLPYGFTIKDALGSVDGRAKGEGALVGDAAHELEAIGKQLESIAKRTGMGPEWRDKMIAYTGEHTAKRLAKHGINVDPAKAKAGEVSATFDKSVTDTRTPLPPVRPQQ